MQELNKQLQQPFFIAHRGANKLAPENTMEALEKAVSLGCKWLEFDVMLTKDHQAILIHDETLDRTTNFHGRVCDYNYSEIAELDAGYYFTKLAEKKHKIPLFRDVVEFMKQHEINAVVEIKPSFNFEIETAAKVMEILQTYWPDFRKYIIVSSFSFIALQKVRALDAHVSIGLSTELFSQKLLDEAKDLNAMSIHIDYLSVNPEICKQIHQSNYSIFCYTVNEPFEINTLSEWGVDAIFSDVAENFVNTTNTVY